MNFTPGIPGSSGAGPPGFLVFWMVKQTRLLEMAPTGNVSDLMVEFIPTGPSDSTGNITCSSHCWEGFSPNPGTARPLQIHGKSAISALWPCPKLSNSTTGCWIHKAHLPWGTKPLLGKGNKTITVHQNLRAAGVIRHCQDLPRVDIH